MFKLLVKSVLAALLFTLAGCASVTVSKPEPFAGLPFRHNAFDFKEAWKLSPAEKGVAIDMALRSVRYLRVDDLEVHASLLRQGKVVAEDTAFLLGSLEMFEYGRVQLLLRNGSPAPGDLLEFRLSYRATEGNNALNWTGSFLADAMTGTTIRKKDEMPAEE